jgi:pyranose oxidase
VTQRRVLIIGSGPVGATFARLLVASGHDVTMIDAGAILSDPPGAHLENAFVFQRTPNLFMDVTAASFEVFSEPTGLVRKRFRRHHTPRNNFDNPRQRFFRNMPFAAAVYAVGGMSTVWTCTCPPHADFELPAALPVSRWRELLSVANDLLHVRPETFADSPVGRVMLQRLNAMSPPDRFGQLHLAARRDERTGQVRWSSTATILGDVLDDPHFTLHAQHRAEELVHHDGRVTGARVRNLSTGDELEIDADLVVVAAGSFLTPRLLWKSGIRPRALGHYLHDHPQAGAKFRLKPEVLDDLRRLPDNPAADHPIPIKHDAIPPGISVEPTTKRPWHGQMLPSGKKFIYMPGGDDSRLLMDVSYYGTATPRFENHISFDRELHDRFGEPQVTVHYRWAWRDIGRALRMWWDMVRAIRTVGRLKGIPVIAPPGTNLHIMGTYRMGTPAQREESVTDTTSKVWGFENLYLGGLGLIPDPTASNPTILACAIAVGAVEAITGHDAAELARLHQARADVTD